jgi:hypothetical protein
VILLEENRVARIERQEAGMGGDTYGDGQDYHEHVLGFETGEGAGDGHAGDMCGDGRSHDYSDYPISFEHVVFNS